MLMEMKKTKSKESKNAIVYSGDSNPESFLENLLLLFTK